MVEVKNMPIEEYLKMNVFRRFIYRLAEFFKSIPGRFAKFGKKIGLALKNFFLALVANIVDIWTTFKNGSWSTRVSYLVMGFGNIVNGQWIRALAFFLMEAVFIFYMIFAGAYWLGKFGTLGTVASIVEKVYVAELDEYVEQTIYVDNSFKILLYGLITIFFIVAFIYTWRLNLTQCRELDKIRATGKKVKSNKDDLESLLDNESHKSILALPIFGMVMFTVLPIIFMILVAFTNYDATNDGRINLFQWVGLDNFGQLFTFGEGGMVVAFGEILAWTLIWAFFATFTNYFLGMFVAMMINKKGIKIKKFWRTVLVMTIAIPQFISLLYVSNLFAENGIVNAALMKWGWIDSPIPFWGDGNLARAMVIIINIWIGIPYLMLSTTGILMNIPQDLYESAKVDGASAFQQFCKITLPYMFFVMGPYLLNNFISNINNFNVIYLLTGGRPMIPAWTVNGTPAGKTSILITWLFGMTSDTGDYKTASVLGFLVFLVVAALSLIVFMVMPSTKREDNYS